MNDEDVAMAAMTKLGDCLRAFAEDDEQGVVNVLNEASDNEVRWIAPLALHVDREVTEMLAEATGSSWQNMLRAGADGLDREDVPMLGAALIMTSEEERDHG